MAPTFNACFHLVLICSGSAGLRQTKTTTKSNVTTCSFPLLDAAKFETRARRTDNAAVLVKGA